MLRLAYLLLPAVLLAPASHAQGPLTVEAPAASPVVVQAQPATTLLLPASSSAAASVLSPNDATLAAEVTATVARIAADVGAQVERGALLLELDCTDLRLGLAQADAQVAAAKARVALASQRLQRAETLAGKNFVSADELLAISTERQAAEADAQVVQAQRAITARQVDKCRITAPFDAVVMERQAQVGALATPGLPLVRLVDVSSTEVEARLPDAEAGGLEGASRIEFESRGRRFPLELVRISEVIEPSTRSRIARLRFSDAAAAAGTSGTLHWQAPGGRLPARLLVQRNGQLGVFVADQGIARFVPVPGAQAGRPADVAQAPGGLIVVDGQQGLHDGTPIQLRD
jgi:RND family efflux transporter MFP subunit